MTKFIYYLRMIIFTIYLITIFLLIDNLYTSQLFVNIYFLLNIIYSFIIILTILSKEKTFKESFSFNIINIGFYIYTLMIYFMTNDLSRLQLVINIRYFNNNYIILSLLIIGLIIYILSLNLDIKEKDTES